MYSGTTFRQKSGHLIGVHQKIDRVARRNIKHLPGAAVGFPVIRDILHFEGNNGPDGIKRKSPSQDEPWHYVDPSDPNDRVIIDMILDHKHNLTEALKTGNEHRAAFEAAWLAHAIVDGLTPAHHYPLSDKIEELWGKPKEERLTLIDKNLIRGQGSRETISKNWQYWGAKGVWATHFMFEWGVATTIKPMRFNDTLPSSHWVESALEHGFEREMNRAIQHIYRLDMYHNFWQNGWTAKLARQTRTILMPEIIRMVTLAWYDAYREAGV